MARLAVGLAVVLALAPVIFRLLRRPAGRRLPRWFVLEVVAVVAAAGALVSLWKPGAIAPGVALVVLGIPTAAVDAFEHRIPDRLSLPLCAAMVLSVVVAAIAANDVGSGARALGSGAGWGAVLLLSYLVTGQPGPGDVKLAPSVGIMLGWWGWTWAAGGFVATYLLTAAVGVVGVLLRRYSLRDGQVPMGPSMVAVALIGATLAQL